ncbi:MAG: trigger factor [Thermoleophilia bacterium]|nr:trigger factor [Thermoleophilia bacterium]
MPVTAEKTKLEDDKVRLDVVVSEDEVEKERSKTMRRLAREVRVPGFRPGKVPAEVVVQRIGQDAANDELLKDALGGWYHTALHEVEVDPIADPDINLNAVPEKGDLIFSATVQLKPTPELGDYKGLEVAKDPAEIPEGAVDARLEELRAAAASLRPVGRAAESGDFISIDFEGRRGGKRMRDAAARDYVVELGADKLVAGFDEQLVGLTAGESVSFSITYAKDDQRPQLRGTQVDYTVKMKRVFELAPPELDDAFVPQISEFERLEELRSEIEERYQEKAEDAVEEMFRRRVIDEAVKNSTVKVPRAMLQTRIQDMLREGQSRLPEGITLEQYLSSRGQSMDQLVKELAPEAEMAVKRELVVQAIAEAEGIQVGDDEVEQQIRDDAERGGRDPDELAAEVDRVNGREKLREDIALRRAVDVLVEAAAPISPETADAREKLWTPGEEKKEPGELWTPGSGPANPQGGTA